MATTYSGDPSASNKDWVRWRIGDTSTSEWLLADAEIDAAISEYGNKRKAAAECARTIGAKFARDVDASVGDLRHSLSQRHTHYIELADEIERKAVLRASPFMGGQTKSRKDSVKQDSDRVVPGASVGQFEYPSNENEERLST